MNSEMRNNFNPEEAGTSGLQIGRQQQVLSLLQQHLLQEEEEENGVFGLYSGALRNAQSSVPSTYSDSSMYGNYVTSSNTIANEFNPAERGSSALDLPRRQQQLQPALNNEISSLNNLYRDALDAKSSANFITTKNDARNATNSFNLDGQQFMFDRISSVETPDMSSGFIPSTSASMGNITAEPSPESCSSEDSEIFSDTILKYINKMLMEEDIEDKFDIYPEHPALLAAEKPFYDILEEKFTPSPDEPPPYSRNHQESLDDSGGGYFANFNRIGDVIAMPGNSQPAVKVEYHHLQTNPEPFLFIDKRSAGNVIQGMEDYPSGSSAASELIHAWQFQKGLEEACKFLPSDDKLVIDLESTGFDMTQEPKERMERIQMKLEDGERKHMMHQRGKKNHNDADLDVQEGRSIKQSATYTEEMIRTKMFDEILLGKGDKCVGDVDETEGNLNVDSSKSSKGSGGSKGRGKRLQPKKELVDLQALLIHCAQFVAVDDHRSAYELLKQIRSHADPYGDSNQRLAHYFAHGLEARLAGTGSQIYHSLIMKRIPITDVLKAYALHVSASPFKRICYYLSSQTILDVAEKATRLHIIDFGIYYGFQWPCFMERLSNRPGGPPRLRITAIDTPMPGFRPSELIDETGRRLADYAQFFGIQFEYHGIATCWETVREEDFKIDEDEVLIVNCMFRMKNVADETVLVDSPRNVVLNTIRKLNPTVFIHGIMNGSYNAPFFATRFREALFYFSALYDLIETTVPREDESRLLIEKVIYGREALNVISCEGSERVERPETYKQWHARSIRAGFVQLRLNPIIVKKARAKYKASYHKDFVIDEDNQWLLQGWKGKIIVAVSTWKPNISS